MGPDSSIPLDFRARARRESERYGHDPWVFVRELLQNARDAGARQVLWTSALGEDGTLSLHCRDDGSGMSFEHARRFLFRLYASSKEGRRGQAGRFGVGFWSVLVCDPETISVSSWPRSGEPWQVELDGSLAGATRSVPAASRPGTEVRLLRRGALPESRAQLAQAVERFGRFLTRLDAPQRPLDVRVDGRAVARPFDLEAPRARFERRGLRGVVGLGRVPRVELLVKGLPVRAAACLQDLLAPEERTRRAPRTELGGGLAPVVLLDSHAVEVQMSRDDVRASDALARLLGLAEDELDRLIESQLECLRPEPPWRRLSRRLGPHAAQALALALLVGAGVALGWALRSRGPGLRASPAVPLGAIAPAAAGPVAPSRVPYRDLGGLYAGPWSNLPAEPGEAAVALRYEPRDASPHFAALVAEPLDGTPPRARPLRAYEAPGCTQACLEIELLAVSDQDWLRLPVPTGHRLDPGSVRVDDGPREVQASEQDEPLVALGSARVQRVRYTTGPGAAATRRAPPPIELPLELANASERLGRLPEDTLPQAARDWVQRRVRYSTSAACAARHHALGNLPFLERALVVGAGDCDVQNGVLARLLTAAGVPARLVIGYLGQDGAALPWLHGWVEYGGPDGSWHVLDASTPRQPSLAAPARAEEAASVEPAEHGASIPSGRPSPSVPVARATALWLALGGLVALLSGAAFGWRRRRLRRELRLDPERGLCELLRGVLQNPQAFDHLPSLLTRPLLPCLERGALELGRAWSLAGSARLFSSRKRSALARRAARARLCVLDVEQAESLLVAEALGAIDLDEWHERLSRAHTLPLAAVNAHLRARGEHWRAALLDGLGAPVLLRLPGVAVLPHDPADALLLVDAGETWLAGSAGCSARQLFETLERLGELLGLDGDARLRLLAEPARQALREVLA